MRKRAVMCKLKGSKEWFQVLVSQPEGVSVPAIITADNIDKIEVRTVYYKLKPMKNLFSNLDNFIFKTICKK